MYNRRMATEHVFDGDLVDVDEMNERTGTEVGRSAILRIDVATFPVARARAWI